MHFLLLFIFMVAACCWPIVTFANFAGETVLPLDGVAFFAFMARIGRRIMGIPENCTLVHLPGLVGFHTRNFHYLIHSGGGFLSLLHHGGILVDSCFELHTLRVNSTPSIPLRQ